MDDSIASRFAAALSSVSVGAAAVEGEEASIGGDDEIVRRRIREREEGEKTVNWLKV